MSWREEFEDAFEPDPDVDHGQLAQDAIDAQLEADLVRLGLGHDAILGVGRPVPPFHLAWVHGAWRSGGWVGSEGLTVPVPLRAMTEAEAAEVIGERPELYDQDARVLVEGTLGDPAGPRFALDLSADSPLGRLVSAADDLEGLSIEGQLP